MKEELVDILDERGDKTGQVMLKSEAHSRGLWHGAAHIWIYNSRGELLLQLRGPKKIVKPNIWDISVAGHIAAGKTPLETAVEEAKEELGLKLNPKDLDFIGNGTIDDIVEPGHWHHRCYLWVYAFKADDLKPADLKLEEDETSAVRWISMPQLGKDLKNSTKASKYSPSTISYELAIEKIPKLISKKAK